MGGGPQVRCGRGGDRSLRDCDPGTCIYSAHVHTSYVFFLRFGSALLSLPACIVRSHILLNAGVVHALTLAVLFCFVSRRRMPRLFAGGRRSARWRYTNRGNAPTHTCRGTPDWGPCQRYSKPFFVFFCLEDYDGDVISSVSQVDRCNNKAKHRQPHTETPSRREHCGLST